MTDYSNPRLSASIDNWPSGSHHVIARFTVETHPSRGQRVVRVTTGAPKALTYALQMRVVDGTDGRTYIAALSHYTGMITIWRGDMKLNEEVIHENNPRYPMAIKLFE